MFQMTSITHASIIACIHIVVIVVVVDPFLSVALVAPFWSARLEPVPPPAAATAAVVAVAVYAAGAGGGGGGKRIGPARTAVCCLVPSIMTYPRAISTARSVRSEPPGLRSTDIPNGLLGRCPAAIVNVHVISTRGPMLSSAATSPRDESPPPPLPLLPVE